ncbi:MAG: hypothetical protein IJT87_08410 [Ruminiclostridium sp.]|nr:hypothetical protein [Ruminiclostridium sp.]
MSLKNKTFQIILKVICGIFFILALFLSVTAVVYSTGGGSPNIFGTNVYLVKTDAFDFLKSGTALMAKQVPPSEIQEKNIVIFNLENGKPALAEVLSSDLSDGVYSFRVLTENNADITLTQSQIVAKGMNYSDFWGALIGFAISPLGMLLIAIVPSIIIIIIEIVKFAGNFIPQPEVETVKKQYEVPTYSREAEKKAQERRGTAEAVKAYRSSSLDSSIGIYGGSSGAPSENPAARRAAASATGVIDTRSEYAEIAARQQKSPLYTAPTRQTRPPQSSPRNTMPLSSKKLNEAIEATKAEHELEDMKKVREQVVKDIQKTRGAAIAAEKEFEQSERIISAAARKTADIAKTTVLDEFNKRKRVETPAAGASRTDRQPRKIQRPPLRLNQPPEEPVRQYTPQKAASTTTSIPRLDALLKDESESEGPYNIDEILAGLDRRQG